MLTTVTLGRFVPTRKQLRAWGTQSAISLTDQALTSAAGFGINVLLARWMSAAQYGAFAVSFAAYLFLTGFHNALLLEPLTIFGPARHAPHLRSYFRAQSCVHAILVCPLAFVAFIAALALWRRDSHSALVGALIGSGVGLPFMLFLWLVRRMCYVIRRPAIAVIGSSIYLGLSLAATVLLHHLKRLTPMNAFVVMGVGSLLGASLIVQQFHSIDVMGEAGPGISWRRVLREDWQFGRWLLGSTVLYTLSTSSQTFFVAGILGLGAAGVLRAMQVPSLAMTQTIAAISLLALPALAYDFGIGKTVRLRRRGMVISVALGGLAVCFAGVLTIGDARIERLLFYGRYAGYARLIPFLALIPVANGICAGFSMVLRAAQLPHFDLIANAVGAAVAVPSTVLFVRWWGLAGAAASMVVSFGVMNSVTAILFVYAGQSLGAKAGRTRSVPPTQLKLQTVARAAFEDDV